MSGRRARSRVIRYGVKPNVTKLETVNTVSKAIEDVTDPTDQDKLDELIREWYSDRGIIWPGRTDFAEDIDWENFTEDMATIIFAASGGAAMAGARQIFSFFGGMGVMTYRSVSGSSNRKTIVTVGPSYGGTTITSGDEDDKKKPKE